MNANTVAKHYGTLTAEERFRLVFAAGARGDDAEQDRLVRAGGRLTRTIPEHAPYGHAFNELATLIFIELVDEAARYKDALRSYDDNSDVFGSEEDEADAGDDRAEDDIDEAPAARADDADDNGHRPIWQRSLDLALAHGYMLRTKAEGWKLFCGRMNVPHDVMWQDFPGFDRLQRAVALTEKAAFIPEGFLSWMNAVRPAGEPELTEVPWTAEAVADATERMFRKRVAWWGG